MTEDAKSKTIETTEVDFAIFQASVKYWLERFGLKGWKIGFVWIPLEGDWAMATINTENRSVLFKYTTNADGAAFPGEHDPDLCGFHEVCELLLDRFWNLTRKADPNGRIVTREDLQETVHSVVRLLENVLYQPAEWDRDMTEAAIKEVDTDAVQSES